MAEKVHVVPAPGRLVLLPIGRAGRAVPPEGVICDRTLFIERRIAFGDLVVVDPEKAAGPPAKAIVAAEIQKGVAETPKKGAP